MRHASSFIDLVTLLLFAALYLLSESQFGSPSKGIDQQISDGGAAPTEVRLSIDVFEAGLRLGNGAQARTFASIDQLLGSVSVRPKEQVVLVVGGGNDTITDWRVRECVRAILMHPKTQTVGFKLERR